MEKRLILSGFLIFLKVLRVRIGCRASKKMFSQKASIAALSNFRC